MRRSIDAADVTAADVEAARRTVRPSLDRAQVDTLRAFAESR
jgi:transitional endoplasmic reticulum ATPase